MILSKIKFSVLIKYQRFHVVVTFTPFKEKSPDYFEDFRKLKLLTNFDVNM